ncbi:helicase [Hanamia caeni]|uniref:Helicase n=1 Tax=Hanamia caeni TaxID=2294116 RepID=A0A3M9NPZ6_9BACT|nr:helicase-related protein [Hanamia caeni]RNI39882.1 helicase [Hanamia caeni]
MHTDLTFFTNEPGSTLLDRFKCTLKDVRYFDILVGYFRSSGFFHLYKSFEHIDKIRILVGLSVDKRTYQVIETTRQKEFDFESHDRITKIFEKELLEEVETAADSKDTEEGIRKFCEFIELGKIEIKAHPSRNLHAKVYISRYKEGDRDFGNVITGSSNFSDSGLVSQREFNVQLKNRSDVYFALEQFEKLWIEAVDISEYYVDTIQKKTWLNETITPYQLYLKLLYEYFREDLNIDEDLFYKNFPKDFMRLKYQEQAVYNAKKILDEYGGVFLSDVVGLGKTYIAAMLANQLPGRNLVIASPALIDRSNPNSWTNVFHEFKVSSHFESVGKLAKIIGEGTDRYDNIFIDEAHKFRSESNMGYELLSQICKGKKVILVTATPLNNKPSDILSQVKLFQKGKNSTIPGVKNLDVFFNGLERRLRNLDRQGDYEEYMAIVKDNAHQIREKVLKHLMVRRTRNEIQKYFKDDLAIQGFKFPNVVKPEPLFYELDDKLDKIFMETIRLITDKKSFSYARYGPLLYLKERLDANEEVRQKNLMVFMKTLLVKRLDSSFYAFRKTLQRFIESYEGFLKAYKKGFVYFSKKHFSKVLECLLDDDFEGIQRLIDDEKAEQLKASDFRPEFKKHLESDLKTLCQIDEMWEKVKKDPKLDKFVESIEDHKVLKQSKIILFTESKETGDYLKSGLEKRLNEKVLFYHGSSHQNELKTVISNFDNKARNKSDEYRILIATEVLSEGINLHRSNVVINYDIPWNPTRMIQRVGRINRVDTPHLKIHTFNFFPTKQSNDLIKLQEAAIAKINYFIEMLGNDARLLTDGEEIKSFELFNKLTSKEFITGEDETQDSELKYLQVITDIRNNDLNLFETIKHLPKKSRTARKALPAINIEENALVTYFRKGRLEKFYIGTKNEANEIDFITTAKLFEAIPETKKYPILSTFYDLLAQNKKQMEADLQDVEIQVEDARGGGKDNAIRVLKILKSKEVRMYKGFTEDAEQFIKDVIKLLEEGSLAKNLTKRIFTELKDEVQPLKIFGVLKKNIPDDYFRGIKTINDEAKYSPREVILSECFIKL